jgi:hypothetical protein
MKSLLRPELHTVVKLLCAVIGLPHCIDKSGKVVQTIGTNSMSLQS